MSPKEKAKELFDKAIYIIQMADKYQYLIRDDEKYLACKIAEEKCDEVIAYAKTFGDVTESDVRFYQSVKDELREINLLRI